MTAAFLLGSAISEAAARGFAESPEYQAISLDRKAGANTLSLLMQGLG
ncbi:DUF1330 domain-containing protein [Pseudomonas sp. NCCP-436]|nr:DUF1330 domain-containing protein [Pseudomonas sp. NCCP-436]GIZ11028.1 hypothetical protein NCCP436_04440 [Pseudomonas sp. NCCP-436]